MREPARPRGHPTVAPKYVAEGRVRPSDPWSTPDTVELHYAIHADPRVVLDASGSPELTDDALVAFSRKTSVDRPTPPRKRRYLTVAEVSRLLELDEASLRKAIRRHHFPAEQPTGTGGTYRIHPDALEAHLYATGHAHERIRDLKRTWDAWLSAPEPEQ